MPNLSLLDSSHLPDEIREFVEALPFPDLGEGEVNSSASENLELLLNTHGLSHNLVGAGLWLAIGELDRSHSISQHDDSSTGSYWHGIMHRREGDYGNAKYWFRRAKGHPMVGSLAAEIREQEEIDGVAGITPGLLSDEENLAVNLVDLVAANVSQESTPAHETLLKVCWWEWQLLMRVTCRQEGAC